MALTPGSRLGSYEISARIGVGGMGEVYRARDTRLGRDVAIKVLPEAFAQDAERLARFDREAKTLATLNHPGIAQIYGIEDAPAGPGQAAVKALVMELVEGPTLADRIAEGPIRLDEALPIAKQIAEALEAAHEQGIVHRDLKPANVKLRPDGAVKVLDFGLAKAMDPAGATSSLSQSPTITTPAMTQAGLILGTAAYMAPEQARGKPLDRRADIWSFGAVLFEMLAGRRAFEGEDVTDTLAAVVRSEPDWSALPADLPARVVRALRVCLQKNPRERGGDIGAIRLALEGAFETTTTVDSSSNEPTPAPWWSQPRWVGALVVLGVLAGVAGGWGLFVSGRADTDLPARRFSIVLPEAQELPALNGTRVAVSPDGQTLAYRAVDSTGVEHIYQRRLDQLTATEVPGTDGAGSDQFFSPDGQSLAFVARGALMRVTLAGGTPTRIAPLPGGLIRGGSWGNGFVIVATAEGFLGRVADTGGEIEPVTAQETGEVHVAPQLLPGGRLVLFTASTSPQDGELRVIDLDSRETRTVVPNAAQGNFTPSGHIVFLRDGDLWAVPFDLDMLTAGDRPALVEQGIRVEGGGAPQFDIADDGSLVYVPGTTGEAGDLGLVWVDDEGQEVALPVPARNYGPPRVSPDGTRVAVEIPGDPAGVIWAANARGNVTLVTDDAGALSPIWAPDGEHLVYSSVRDGVWGFYRKSADGAGEEELLGTVENVGRLLAGNWTPDGESLVFSMQVGAGFDIGVFSVEDGTWEPLLDSDDVEFGPSLSPDGQWIAYSSTETGTMQVYARRFPDLSDKQPISDGSGIDPTWSSDGGTLYFLSTLNGVQPDGVVAVSFEPGPPLDVGSARVLFPHRYVRPGAPSRFYDLSEDGRFLFVSRAEDDGGSADRPQAATITWVQNWFTDLRRLAPAD